MQPLTPSKAFGCLHVNVNHHCISTAACVGKQVCCTTFLLNDVSWFKKNWTGYVGDTVKDNYVFKLILSSYFRTWIKNSASPHILEENCNWKNFFKLRFKKYAFINEYLQKLMADGVPYVTIYLWGSCYLFMRKYYSPLNCVIILKSPVSGVYFCRCWCNCK